MPFDPTGAAPSHATQKDAPVAEPRVKWQRRVSCPRQQGSKAVRPQGISEASTAVAEDGVSKLLSEPLHFHSLQFAPLKLIFTTPETNLHSHTPSPTR